MRIYEESSAQLDKLLCQELRTWLHVDKWWFCSTAEALEIHAPFLEQGFGQALGLLGPAGHLPHLLLGLSNLL